MASRPGQSQPSSDIRCRAGPLQSSRSEPPVASTQCADEERRRCGTDGPEPSSMSFIRLTPFCRESADRLPNPYREGKSKKAKGRSEEEELKSKVPRASARPHFCLLPFAFCLPRRGLPFSL